MVRPLSIVLVAMLCLAGCSRNTPAASKGQASGPGTATQATPAPSAATPPDAALAGKEGEAAAIKPFPAELPEVLARVNGEPITKIEFQRALGNVEARAGGSVPPDQRDRVFRGVLGQLVGYKLLLQESRARHVKVPDAEVDQRVTALRGQFPSEDAFAKQLAQQHVTLEQVKSDARQELAVAQLLRETVAAKVSVKPADVEAFYQQNLQRFEQPERVRASHILITAPKTADAATRAKARAKADDLLKQVQAGKDFAVLAKANSQDPGSAANGGDLGYFQKGQMVGPFNDVAFLLKPGSVSGVVETDFGYHIIKVVDRQPARVVPLDEARPQVQAFLEAQARDRETQTFLSALKDKGKVDILV